MTPELHLDATHGKNRTESPTPLLPARYLYDLGPQLVHGHTGIALYEQAIIHQSGPPLRDLQWVAAKAGVAEEIQAVRSHRRQPVDVAGPVFPLGREPIPGYYHWIVDILPRVLHATNFYPDLTVVGSKIPHWAKSMIDLLEIKSLVTSEVVRSPKVLVADHTERTVHPIDVALLREAGRRIAKTMETANRNKRVFVTRTGASRTIADAGAADRRAEELGFEVMIPSKYPDYASQVAVFRRARRILGLHGAGLVNVVFAEPGAEVIEVRVDPAPLRGSHRRQAAGFANPLFRNLALSAGHQYIREVISPSSGAPFGRAQDVIPILERHSRNSGQPSACDAPSDPPS